MVEVPHRFEEGVGEAQEVDVQHRPLASKVIDAKDLVLGEHLVRLVVENPARG